MPDSAALDLARLEEAFEDDVAGIAELLEMALDTGRKHCRKLAEGLAEGNVETIRRAAHSIKGSAATIGANEVTALASQLEQQARAGDVRGAAEAIANIDAAYARVEEEVRAYRTRIGG
ncbi:MAG: Hpt domain-containing protein [Candidatus Eremiobacteraeota bacterium]|nr:Hpt domain-containing protein [Candidatus Eremiobacteraeota bacterium]